jgi:hypothetical protein
VPIAEAEDGLLRMLENEDFQMCPVTRSFLFVPIFNRVDFLLRLHKELINKVVNMDLNGYWRVLGFLQFLPRTQWHQLVQNNNT